GCARCWSIACRTIPSRAAATPATDTCAWTASTPSRPEAGAALQERLQGVVRDGGWRDGCRPVLEAVTGRGALLAVPAIEGAHLDVVVTGGQVGRQRAAPQMGRRLGLGRAVMAAQGRGGVVARVLGHQPGVG